MLRIRKVDRNNLKEIPNPCKYCLYWQRTGSSAEKILKPEKESRKLEWFDKVIGEFGRWGCVAYLSGVPTGFIQYAKAGSFPRVKEYASGPPSEDSVFLACLHIADREARRKGLGTVILEKLLVELRWKGFKAIETFVRRNSQNNPSGPLEFYLKRGFKIEADRDDFPLVRFEFLA